MRALQGALLTSEVLRERERQQGRASKRKELEKQREQQVFEAEMAQLKVAEHEEVRCQQLQYRLGQALLLCLIGGPC